MDWLCRARVTCVLAQAKKQGREFETIVLLIAGNDVCDEKNDPADIAWEMDVRLPRFRFCVSLVSMCVLNLSKITHV